MDNEEDGDSIVEIGLDKNVVFGKEKNLDSHTDNGYMNLMRAVMINIREGENLKDSQHMLISMLEKILSRMKAEEKKRILKEEYGMIMTIELEERIQLMCDLSENIEARGIEKGRKEERIKAIENMIKIGAMKNQIILCGYSEEKFAEAEEALFAGV